MDEIAANDASKDQMVHLSIEIGRALHFWSAVETEVSHLFMIMHARAWNDFSHPLRAAFEAVISFETRLAMIRATVSSDPDIPRAYEEHFNALYNKLMKSYKKRHEIAHFMFVSRGHGEQEKCFVRPFFRWQAFEANTGLELSLQQVEDRGKSFNELIDRVVQHRQNVGRLKGLSAEYYAQAGDLAHPDLVGVGQYPEEPELPLVP